MKTTITTIALAAAFANAGTGYTVRDLGTIGVEAEAHGINNAGVAVGLSYDTIAAHLAVRFDDPTPVPLLGPGPAEQREAVAINDSGLVAALAYSLNTLGANAYISDGALPPTDIGQLIPRAIDGQGRVVGARPVLAANVYSEHAAWWNGSERVDLPAFANASWSIAHDIDASGRIVGSAIPAGARRPSAVLWENGTASDLGTLGGASAQALGINGAGDVVGVADTAAGRPHAFLYHIDSGAVTERLDLGFLGGESSAAYDVNDSRQVVGASFGHAFLWENGAMHDLNDLVADLDGWDLQSAEAINASGVIVGHGLHAPWGRRAFMLVPDTGCPADLNGDGILDLADISAFIIAFTGHDPVADLTGDGILDLDDISAFIVSFTSGCP